MKPSRQTASKHSTAGLDTDADFACLASQAYGRVEWSGSLLRRCHSLKRRDEERFKAIEPLYRWLLVPISLWPFDIQKVLAAALKERVTTSRSVFSLLLDVLPPTPDENAIRTTTAHEHDVQAGRYEHLVKVAEAKFSAEKQELSASKELRADWRSIKTAFPVHEFADHKGVIRRTMVSERNLTRGFDLDWSDPAKRFQAIFDAFCAKWNLYGMQKDKPLLLKLSVNLTAYGTMIFIPAYWSIDFKRDLDFRAISRLHSARVPHRQGPAIAENKRQRRAMARKLDALDAELKRLGLSGERKRQFLCKGLGRHPDTDSKYFARLRKEFGG